MTDRRTDSQPEAVSKVSLSATAADGGWPGGWYVYENGKVDGPFSAAEAFRLDAETSDGKPRLVSRKGFTQWYALKDLSEIFKMTEHLGRQVAQQTELTEAQLSSMTLQAAPVAERVKAPVKKHLGPERTRAVAPVEFLAAPEAVKSREELEIDAAARAAAKAAAVPTPADLDFPATAPASLFPSNDKAALRPSSARKPLRSEAKQSKAALMQEYFLSRGRLRLGKLRNPWISAFVGLPLTVGGLWYFWMRDAGRELVYHARNTETGAMPPAGLALIPLVHFFMIYKLAKLVVEMEAQNKYRSVSPAVAVLFGIFPPFAMAYLQDALNRHWLLHARHAMAKRRAVAGSAKVANTEGKEAGLNAD